MKKILLGLSILLVLASVFSSSVLGQGMMNWDNKSSTISSSISSTEQEEANGKEIWEQLQSKKRSCSSLKDDDFELLGEFFMGQSIGSTERHAVMNQMMKSMMGEKGEAQMHVALGKRLSGCDANASFPSGYGLPMMWWMMGGGGSPMMGFGGWNNMMGGGFGAFGLIWMILFWVLLILAVVALFRYLGGASRSNAANKSALDILKERYAKGEIDKKEYEEKKKDFT